MTAETLRTLVDIGTMIGGLTTVATLMRRWLTKELRMNRAATFRIMKGMWRQSRGIVALWECMNRKVVGKKCNGATEAKIKAVEEDADKMADWVRGAALGTVPVEEEEV